MNATLLAASVKHDEITQQRNELLAALQNLMEWFQNESKIDDGGLTSVTMRETVKDAARSAIARAEGRQA